MSGLFGSITIKGNRLTEFASQTATVGVPIPFGYGRFPCEGNIIFAPLPPKEHVKKKKQGKGGVKTEEYSYTLSYAIAFCKGPIYGYWTIKRNGKVVYTQDPNASIDDKAYAAKWAQRATFYYGTPDQLPDSTIESYKGSGNVSAFRDLAYIVVEDDDVTDGGGAVPTYEAVIVASPPDLYLTSKPYNIVADDDVVATGVEIARDGFGFDEHVTAATVSALAAELREVVEAYTMETESVEASVETLVAELREVLIPYETLPEHVIASAVATLPAELREVLIPYENFPPEFVSSTVSALNGELT